MSEEIKGRERDNGALNSCSDHKNKTALRTNWKSFVCAFFPWLRSHLPNSFVFQYKNNNAARIRNLPTLSIRWLVFGARQR